MCDYSLHQVASRPARLGEKLVTTKFPHSITRGFASVDDPEVAVCLLPGTELAFEQQVRCETSHCLRLERRARGGEIPTDQQGSVRRSPRRP